MIPAPYRLLIQAAAVALAVAAAVAWWHSHNAAQQKIGYDKANSEWLAKVAKADEAEKEKAIARAKEKEKAQDEAAKRQIELESIAAGLRADRDRVRNENANLHARINTLAVDAARRVAEAGITVFGECSDRYSAVAIAADECLSERQTLIAAWPK